MHSIVLTCPLPGFELGTLTKARCQNDALDPLAIAQYLLQSLTRGGGSRWKGVQICGFILDVIFECPFLVKSASVFPT